MTIKQHTHAVGVDWLAAGTRTVAATLVEVQGSGPFDVGATMLIGGDGQIEGSVTGGCVESALFEEAQHVLAGEPPRLRTYGISDSEAAGVGLMCGGTVRVFIRELDPAAFDVFRTAAGAVEEGRGAALATLLDGPEAGSTVSVVDGQLTGSFGVTEKLDASVRRDAVGCIAHGISVLRRFGAGGEVMGDDLRVFVDAFSAPPRLVIFGAIDFSVAVAAFAKRLGYHVTVCDARPAFASSPRFRVADEVVMQWPQEYLRDKALTRRDAVLVFTHDPKFDEPALRAALETDAGYIGALGSRRTQRDRAQRLTDAGVDDAALERIVAPCGLDIGARTAEETAVSILAEIIGRSTGRFGQPLSETTDPIHASREPAQLG